MTTQVPSLRAQVWIALLMVSHGEPAMSSDYNLLILPSTGHARDFGDTQFQPGLPGG